MGGLQLLEPALAKGPRGLFSLFLQEIYSDARADTRRNPRFLVPSLSREQREDGSFLDQFCGH
jgi:hypothetical protein